MTAFAFDDPDHYVNGTPHEAFSRLRKEAPLAWHASSQQRATGFWLVTRHEHIVAISKNPKLFATHSPLLGDPIPRPLWPVYPALAMIADNLVTFDHQKHPAFRSLANSLFSTAKLAEMEDRIRAACVEILARVADRDQFDFANDVALEVPVKVILGQFLGIPDPDLAKLTRIVLTINAMDDPFYSPRQDAMWKAAEELSAYGLDLFRRMQSAPVSGLMNELIWSRRLDGVSQQQLFIAYWFPLAAGAFDTTAATIAGGVRALLHFPDQLARLRDDPRLVPRAVDEMLRWVSPVIYFRRTATADTVIEGHAIKEKQRVVLCYASANRDEAVFRDPGTFDLGREPNPHVSFGYGPHFCLGARLAMLVIRVFFEEYVRRVPALQLAAPVIHTRSAWMNRIRSMPVRRSSER